MNAEKLSLRLTCVANFIQTYGQTPCYLADIGTDHAYLPVYLVNKGIVSRAVAGDVVQGPFLSATKEVQTRNLDKKISVRLGSGLDVIEPEDEINIISICGMGGKLIAEILEDGLKKINNHTYLVLQANNGEATLRQWLQSHSCHLVEETILEEDDHIYEIIVAYYDKEKPNQILLPEDILLGPINRKVANSSFKKKWSDILERNQEIIKSIQHSNRKNYDKIKAIREINQVIERGLELNEK